MATTAQKRCFVTIGATTGFKSLIEAVLTPQFISELRRLNYSHLRIQYGKGGQGLLENLPDVPGLHIDGFDLNPNGLMQDMAQVRSDTVSNDGVVITHAGSGTILEALRVGVTTIVVPNTDLLDNHQIELAEELSNAGYVVHGQLRDMPQALRDAEKLKAKLHDWPPKWSKSASEKSALLTVMDEEMGMLD